MYSIFICIHKEVSFEIINGQMEYLPTAVSSMLSKRIATATMNTTNFLEPLHLVNILSIFCSRPGHEVKMSSLVVIFNGAKFFVLQSK